MIKLFKLIKLVSKPSYNSDIMSKSVVIDEENDIDTSFLYIKILADDEERYRVRVNG